MVMKYYPINWGSLKQLLWAYTGYSYDQYTKESQNIVIQKSAFT